MRAVLAMLLLTAAARAQVEVTLVNYGALPVHAAAVALDGVELRRLLGAPAETPLRAVRADTGQPVPSSHTATALTVYAGLGPRERLALRVETTAAWPLDTVAAATGGELRNGCLRFAYGQRGWRFGFDTPGPTWLVQDAALDFWVDTQNRGRLMNAPPQALGLQHFADAQWVEQQAGVVAGRPSLTVRRRLGALLTTETFTLQPGLPALVQQIVWRNEGAAPLWLAYVGSGTGTTGRWARPLMAPPLIERQKSPVLGELNGGQTRCAWLPGCCRVSMESPASGCGIGLGTLAAIPGKVGTGSMVWGLGAGGFQCNLLDPQVGQLPFGLEPHGERANGFVFLATQAGQSVYRQMDRYWRAVTSGQVGTVDPPCAVFVAGRPVAAQTVTRVETTSAEPLALRLDFNHQFRLRASVEAPLTLTARGLSGGRTVTLLRAAQSGEQTVDLNQTLGARDEAALVIEAAGAGRLARLTIEETLPDAPGPLSPLPDARVTDFATMFRWCSLPLVTDYELQWAGDDAFTQPHVVKLATSGPHPWYLPPEAQLPAAGEWRWRVRGLKGDLASPWSAARRFTVSTDHTTTPPLRPLTADRPLFTFEAPLVRDWTTVTPDLPADLAPSLAVIAEGFVGQGQTIDAFTRGLDKLPCGFLLRSREPTWIGLADFEWCCQHYANFLGMQGGETLGELSRESRRADNGEADYHRRLLRLLAKYGRFYQEADGTFRDDKWQELWDRQRRLVEEYGPWLVLTQKNNIIRRQFYSQSAALGLWLGGLTAQHGAWEDGGFYWQNAGFDGLGVCRGERSGVLATMPRIFWDLVAVLGLGRGCALYSFDGQTLQYSAKAVARNPAARTAAALWDDRCRLSDTARRFVLPLVRAIVEHRLVPTREQVLANVKLAVYNDHPPADLLAWPYYVEYGPLFAATYGFRRMGQIDGQLWEFFPNTGRYHCIPALVQGDRPLGPGVRNVPLSQLASVEQVRATFDAAYPAWYAGDALVERVGDTLTVLNSRENDDVAERFAVDWSAGPVTRVAGVVAPHTYLVAKREGARLWLQANSEYPDRPGELTLSCPAPPRWQAQPAGSASGTWDEAARELRLRLNYQPGAVELTLEKAER